MSDTLEADAPAAADPAPAADTAPSPEANAASAPVAEAPPAAAADDGSAGNAGTASSLSQDHLDWAAQFTGVQVGSGAPGGGAPGEAAPGGFLDAAKSLWNSAGEAVEAVEAKAKDVASSVEDGASAAWDKAKEVGGEIEDGASAAWDKTKETAAEVEQQVEDGAGAAWNKAKEIGGAIEDGASAAWNKTKETAAEVEQQVEDGASAAWDKAKEIGGKIKDEASAAWDKAKAIPGEIEDKINETKGDVKDWWDNHEDYAKAQPPLPKVAIGAPQQERADKLLGEMPEDEKTKVKDLLDKASPEAKTYLTKALASKHSAAELEEFAKKIEGKDQKWMDEHLHLVGEPNGRGIKQQWSDSCGPTTVQAMKGELDPLYSLQMHENNAHTDRADNADGMATNPNMAQRQKDALEAGGGVAVARDATGGNGMVLDDLLNAQQDKTGVKFDIQDVESGDEAMTKGLDQAQKALKSGLPVPIRVGDATGGHFILMTGVTEGPPRTFGFHDPWRGINQNYTEEQIKKQQLDIAGWSKMTDIFQPTATGK